MPGSLTHPRHAMFTPSQHDVRRFFCETQRKQKANEILTPLEAVARDWVLQHPEYDAALADSERALATNYAVESGQTNPFLHLSAARHTRGLSVTGATVGLGA
jgi:hypothetical protein